MFVILKWVNKQIASIQVDTTKIIRNDTETVKMTPPGTVYKCVIFLAFKINKSTQVVCFVSLSVLASVRLQSHLKKVMEP